MHIAILAREKRDPILKNLYYWLQQAGHKATMLYTDDLFNRHKLKFEAGHGINEFRIELDDGSVVTENNVDVFFLRHDPTKSTKGLSETKKFRAIEYNAFISFFCAKIKSKNKVIGYCSALSNNKLFQLDTARKIGLYIPMTVVTNNEKEVKIFQSKKALITKAIQGVFIEKKKDGYITNYTSRISNSDNLEDLDLTLYQSEVKKKFELRVYFLIDEFYCVASKIDNAEEEIDIRILMAQQKVDYFEYDLPSKIKNKLIMLKSELGIDTFSADIIVNDCFDYYLIDINPHGQISMLAQTKIRNLEKRIAEKIIEYGKRSREKYKCE